MNTVLRIFHKDLILRASLLTQAASIITVFLQTRQFRDTIIQADPSKLQKLLTLYSVRRTTGKDANYVYFHFVFWTLFVTNLSMQLTRNEFLYLRYVRKEYVRIAPTQ